MRADSMCRLIRLAIPYIACNGTIFLLNEVNPTMKMETTFKRLDEK